MAVVDYNKIQSFGTVAAVLDLEPLAAKWRAFGWAVRELDGHDHRQDVARSPGQGRGPVDPALLTAPAARLRPVASNP